MRKAAGIPRPGDIFAHAALAAGATIMIAPFIWMTVLAFAPQGEIFSGRLLPWPSLQAGVENFAFAFSRAPLLRYMLNGALVCAAILVLQLMIAAPAGYALAKLPFTGRPLLYGAVVIGLMIPIQVPAIPLYIAFANAGLLDTYTALVLPFIISCFAIFLFRQFFTSYPDEVLDAARLDGFSELAIVWRLLLPAAWPAVASFSIFSVVAHWNDLYWPLVVITRPELMTPPMGIAAFRQSGESVGNVGALMAGGLVVTAPLVIAFAFAQKHFIRGLSVPNAVRRLS
jgi:multiple sugar transport system permease protein